MSKATPNESGVIIPEVIIPEVRIELKEESDRQIILKKKITSADYYKDELIPLIAEKIENSSREQMIIVNLDASLKPINYFVVSKGVPSTTTCYYGEIIKTSLLSNASSVIIIHNHPDESKTFSYGDLMASARLRYLLSLVNIELCDSVLIPRGKAPQYLKLEHEEDFHNLMFKYSIKLDTRQFKEFEEIADRVATTK